MPRRKTYLSDTYIGEEIDTIERCQYCDGYVEPTDLICPHCSSVLESLTKDDD